MSFLFRILFSSNKKKIFYSFFLLFCIALLQRGSTLEISYYNVDELNEILIAQELLEGGKAYIDIIPERPVTTGFFYLVFWLFGSGNIFALHMSVIVWIWLSSLLLYQIQWILWQDRQTAFWSAFFYAIYSSGFFEYYLAVHGEILFNLPVILALYLFILAKKKNKFLLYILSGITLSVAFFTKGHTLMLLFALGFYLIILEPFLLKPFLSEERTSRKTTWFKNVNVSVLLSLGFLIGLLLFFVSFWSMDILKGVWENYILHNVSYASAGLGNRFDHKVSLNILDVLYRFFYKVGQNMITQFPLWIFALFFFLKQKTLRNTQSLLLTSFLLFSFLGVFLGGLRLYNHYFIQYLPALCLIAGLGLNFWMKYLKNLGDHSSRWRTITNKAFIYFLVLGPVGLYSFWNYRNLYYLNRDPRQVKTLGGYILPKDSFYPASIWLKEQSNPKDRIFEWGNCIEIYFFSQRKTSTRLLWSERYMFPYTLSGGKRSNELDHYYFDPKTLERIQKKPLEDQFSLHSLEDIQYSIILDLEKKKPLFFIDTTFSQCRTNFIYDLGKLPIFQDYIHQNYQHVKTITGIKIYLRSLDLKNQNSIR